jgi:hypothetical protein
MAGCIFENADFAGGVILEITPLGKQVLGVLEAYIAEKRNA